MNKAQIKEEPELLFVPFFIKIRYVDKALCLHPLTRNRCNLLTLKNLHEHIHDPSQTEKIWPLSSIIKLKMGIRP